MGEGEKITCEWGVEIVGAQRWNEGDNGRREAVMKRSVKPESRSARSSVGPSCTPRTPRICNHFLSCNKLLSQAEALRHPLSLSLPSPNIKPSLL